jgi:hypothetical protein
VITTADPRRRRQADQESRGKLASAQIGQGVDLIIIGAIVFAMIAALVPLFVASCTPGGHQPMSVTPWPSSPRC